MRTLMTLWTLTIVLLACGGSAFAEEDAQGELVLRIYPVGELTHGRMSYVRPAEPVVAPDRVSDERRPLFGGPLPEPTFPLGTVDELVELIQVSVDPFFWEQREGAQIYTLGELRIAVRATEAVHAKVLERLREFERMVGRTVTIELESWHVEKTRAEGLLGGEAQTTLGAAALDQLRRAGTAGPAVSITAFSGQMAVAWGGRQVSWIGDADVEVAQESSSTDPIVLVSNLGLMVQAMAAVAPDDTVLLGLDAALAEIAVNRTLATLRNGSLQAPHHDVTRIRPVVHVPSGAWVVLDGQMPAGGDAAWVFVARATVHDVARRTGVGPHGVIDLGPSARGRPATDRVALRFFDVRDLTTPVRSLPSLPPHLWPSNYSPPQPHELPEPEPAIGLDELVELIREGDHGEVWEDPATIEGRNGMLIVRNTPEVLARVERTIAAVRRAAPWTLVVAAEVVELPAAMAAPFGENGLLSDAAVEALHAARRAGDATSLDALRLTSMRGRRNVVRVGTVVNYLQDYEVEIAQASEIGNPVFMDVFVGSQLALTAGLAPDGQAALLEVDFVRTGMPMPIQKLNTTHGEVELPELEIFQLRTAIDAPFGRTILVGSWGHEGRRRMLLLTPVLR